MVRVAAGIAILTAPGGGIGSTGGGNVGEGATGGGDGNGVARQAEEGGWQSGHGAEAVERLKEEVGKRRAVGEVLRSDAADGWLGRGSGGGGDGGGGI